MLGKPEQEFTMGDRIYTYNQVGATVAVRYKTKPVGSIQADGGGKWNASVLPIAGSETTKYPGLPSVLEGLIAITRTYNSYLFELEKLNKMYNTPVDPKYSFH